MDCCVVRQVKTCCGKVRLQTRELAWWQAVMFRVLRLGDEDLRKIDNCMTGHCKSEFCLMLTVTLDADAEQSTTIQDRSERGQPRLIAMLRAEVAQDSIREMALHQFGRPALPI